MSNITLELGVKTHMILNGYNCVVTKRLSYSRKYTKSRFYVQPVNETIMDNLINRRNRPISEYRAFAKDFIAQVFDVQHTLRWSQKAGCSMCPCSPGFIVDGIQYGYDYNIDIVSPVTFESAIASDLVSC